MNNTIIQEITAGIPVNTPLTTKPNFPTANIHKNANNTAKITHNGNKE
ncbi:hypothetical protein [Methanosarcina sp. 2.H.A.1B.4]|nr:hypothetical protein [Methanosarcina sp. 2.H.A.1B.4]